MAYPKREEYKEEWANKWIVEEYSKEKARKQDDKRKKLTRPKGANQKWRQPKKTNQKRGPED